MTVTWTSFARDSRPPDWAVEKLADVAMFMPDDNGAVGDMSVTTVMGTAKVIVFNHDNRQYGIFIDPVGLPYIVFRSIEAL